MRTEMVLGVLANSQLNYMTQLLAWESLNWTGSSWMLQIL